MRSRGGAGRAGADGTALLAQVLPAPPRMRREAEAAAGGGSPSVRGAGRSCALCPSEGL